MQKESKMYMQQISRMKVGRTVALLFFLFLTLGSSIYGKGKAGIVFDKRNVNIGTVYKANPIKVFYLNFKNNGNENLMITDVRTDCDCTTTEYSSEPVAPNLSGRIKVKIDLHKFFPCEILKKIAVYSNANKRPIVIKIKGKVMY